MSAAIILSAGQRFRLLPEPLTPESFAPYGTVIASPLLVNDQSTTPPPPSPPLPQIPAPVLANQNSALKYSPISPLEDHYRDGRCPSGKSSKGHMSLFSCFPRKLRPSTTNTTAIFDVGILERHPFTTQTFSPLGLSALPVPDANSQHDTFYLVLVAPTLKGQVAAATTINGAGAREPVLVYDPPNLSGLKAFVAHGGQAITYGVGTWHAPMVVVGRRRVDFLVVQFMNGARDEDCQEVMLREGIEVEVGIPVNEKRTGSKI